jgi:serine/threonine protein kinase
MTAVLSVGQVLDGRYEVLAPIAQGGMGSVFRARRLLLGDEVAIKTITAEQAEAARIRFMRESRACARLRHPNIVSILDFDIDPLGNPFLVMELLNGRSLKDEIAARGRLDVSDVQQIVPPLCLALQFAHSCGIVHRDLKPANIVAHDFGDGQRVYKIVDFGIADIRGSTDATRLTDAHQFLGTIAYASPERLTGARTDHRADLYSLGSVVFEMLTGRVPFEGDDVLSVVTQHLSTPAPRPSSLRDHLPAWIDEAVGRALAKNPVDRWGSIAEFGARLADGAAGGATPALRPSVASRLAVTYDIGNRVGPGRLGSEVFRGMHRVLGHPVAIRLLHQGGERNWDGVRARFLREAKTLQVAHPSILHVRDYGEEAGLVYLVTDFIDGPSLRELMVEAGPLPWTRLQPLLAQLVEAAHVLHRHNGLLCGLSPDIIRVEPASAAGDEPERVMISTAGIWQAQDLLSTLQDQTLRGLGLADTELRYVAPELWTGHRVDVRSDVFTLAVVAYEMATGALPYDGSSMPELLGAMLAGSVEDPRHRQPTLPEPAAAALVQALRPRPEERFASAKGFGAALLSGS